MIISASNKTDILVFYGEWFMKVLRAGYHKVANPYNKRIRHVLLRPDAVNGIVFWTKNAGPFMRHFSVVKRLGLSFVLQRTINFNLRALEHAVVRAESEIEHIRLISEIYRSRGCRWCYDAIIDFPERQPPWRGVLPKWLFYIHCSMGKPFAT